MSARQREAIGRTHNSSCPWERKRLPGACCQEGCGTARRCGAGSLSRVYHNRKVKGIRQREKVNGRSTYDVPDKKFELFQVCVLVMVKMTLIKCLIIGSLHLTAADLKAV